MVDDLSEVFENDEAFLTIDMGSQGPDIEWTCPATGEVVCVSVPFAEQYPFLGLNQGGIHEPASLGEGMKPAWIYVDSLEVGLQKMLAQVGYEGMKKVRLIGGDAEQHGITLLNQKAKGALSKLDPAKSLRDQLGPAWAYSDALTWQTGNTQVERKEIEERVGLEKLIEINGSGVPLRYSGTMLRWAGKHKELAYKRTRKVHLIESLLGATLTGDVDFPVSWGGACGTGLWDYTRGEWSEEVLAAAAHGLQGGGKKLERILPNIARLDERFPISSYFAQYGLVNAEVVPFVGDNPASRMLVPSVKIQDEDEPGCLISIASSITLNLGQKIAKHDPSGNLLQMFDYKEDPFLLACKSCGTNEWDDVKEKHNVDYAEQDDILRAYIGGIVSEGGSCAPGEMYFKYSKKETFPKISVPFERRVGKEEMEEYSKNKEIDVRAVIETGLADIAVHAKDFLPENQSIYVVGGATESEEILKIFAAMLDRDIIVCEESTGGAAHGSNIALQMLHAESKDKNVTHAQFVAQAGGTPIKAPQELVNYYHREGGYLDTFKDKQMKAISEAEKKKA